MIAEYRFVWVRNVTGATFTEYHYVDDIDIEALYNLQNELAAIDLEDDKVTWNTCDLEVFESGEWLAWWSKEGDCFEDIMVTHEHIIKGEIE